MSDEHIALIVTGYDAVLPTELTKDDQTFVIDPGATVKAALVSVDRNTVFIAPVTVSVNQDGSDWANSLVVPKFPASETVDLEVLGDALIEFSVDDGERIPFFVPAQIVKGNIS